MNNIGQTKAVKGISLLFNGFPCIHIVTIIKITEEASVYNIKLRLNLLITYFSVFLYTTPAIKAVVVICAILGIPTNLPIRLNNIISTII